MTCGVLLAAGQGTRFLGATHKLLALIDGRPVIARSLEAMLGAGFDNNIVVTGAVDLSEFLAGRDRLTVVPNPRYLAGMGTSLDAAIATAFDLDQDSIVVGLGDQPFVATGSWQRVAASRAPIAVATYRGRPRNPVRLHASVWPRLAIDGDDGARRVLRALPELVQPVPCEGSAEDIDTVEDLRRWN